MNFSRFLSKHCYIKIEPVIYFSLNLFQDKYKAGKEPLDKVENCWPFILKEKCFNSYNTFSLDSLSRKKKGEIGIDLLDSKEKN